MVKNIRKIPGKDTEDKDNFDVITRKYIDMHVSRIFCRLSHFVFKVENTCH